MNDLIFLYYTNGMYLGVFDCENVIPITGDIIITDSGKFEVMGRELNYSTSEIKLFVKEYI